MKRRDYANVCALFLIGSREAFVVVKSVTLLVKPNHHESEFGQVDLL